MLTYKIRDNDSSYAVVATDGNETEPIHVTGEHQNAKILIGVLTDNDHRIKTISDAREVTDYWLTEWW